MLNFNTTKALSTLMNPDKILPVAMIEVACTGGRTYNGYKRGGKVEGRERLREETTGAVFWLFGVKVLNKIGDFIGNKIGIKNLDVDLGKDELRAPFLNNVKEGANKTIAFKFAKVASSAAIATFFLGFVLPKINQKITELSRSREENSSVQSASDTSNLSKSTNAYENSNGQSVIPLGAAASLYPSMDSFMQSAREQNISFKGASAVADFLSTAAYNLENKTAWRLMSTDVGMIAGRVVNSRNKVEGFEFLFRDTTSIYF